MSKRSHQQLETVNETRVNDASAGVLSPLHHLIHLLTQALGHRANPPARIEMEKWAMLIGEVMSARWRHYHVPEHVFSMCAGTTDALEILSILFHDIIFLQVDRRIHPKLQKYLYDFSPTDVYEVTLHGPVGTKEYSVLPLVYAIFRVQPGQKMSTSTGLNELLSAVTALRILKPYLSTWEMMQIAGCIEATIPFRSGAIKDQSTAMKLTKTYVELSQEYQVQVSSDAIEQGVLRSIHVANLDIRGFSSENSSVFLSDTWNLLLEGNPVFKNPFYTVNQYLSALEKVERFYSYLDPHSIPSQYLGYPSSAQLRRLVEAAQRNINIGKLYLHAKILGNSILQSVSQLTGGDAPLILFLGDIHSDTQGPAQLEQYLDLRVEEVDPACINLEVLQLLSAGRAGRSSFDLRNSPLSAYVYSRLSPEIYKQVLEHQKSLSMGKMTPLQFLSTFPIDLMAAVLNALAQVAQTRAEGILDLKKTLQSQASRSQSQQAA